jgi:endonuclease YncB( thermonuclease family)
MLPSQARRFAVLAATLALGFGPAGAAGLPESVKGPIEARVVAVVDGDTLMVRARPWVGMEVETKVRLLGIDAPELKGRCAAERRRAKEARAFLERAVGGNAVTLHDVRHDKYGGRVLARVETASGKDCARALLDAGLARAYGGKQREPWCPND